MATQALSDQILNDQTLKAQIVAELDHLSIETLTQVLTYVQSLNPEPASTASTPTAETVDTADPEGASVADTVDTPPESAFLKGYQRSKHNREEVYRRLANS